MPAPYPFRQNVLFCRDDGEREVLIGKYVSGLKWELEQFGDGPMAYFRLKPMDGGGPIEPCAGVMVRLSEECPTGWVPFVSVDDLEGEFETIIYELGGEVLIPPMTLAAVEAKIAIVRDIPEIGYAIGLWEGQV